MTGDERADVVVVSGDAVWPPHHGGRIRVARIVEELARRLDVCVVAAVEAEPPSNLTVEVLPSRQPMSRVAELATPLPRLGRIFFDHRRAAVLHDVLSRRRPRVVMFASSYVAAAAPPINVPTVVDFPDIECRRMASMATSGSLRSRAVHRLESMKARWWEPRLARRASLVTSPDADDVGVLTAWGADAVLVPHGTEPFEPSRSPRRGPVLFVASFSYGPNVHALDWLLSEVWPRVTRVEPGLRLQVVGRRAHAVTGEADGIEVVTDPDDISPYYQQASLALAPVRVGGGPQLKVTEALSHGRALVATSYSSRSVPPSAVGAVVVADEGERFADAVLHLWRDIDARRAAEKAAAAALPFPTWGEACGPLVARLERTIHAG